MELSVLRTRKTCKTQYLILGNHGTLKHLEQRNHVTLIFRSTCNTQYLLLGNHLTLNIRS